MRYQITRDAQGWWLFAHELPVALVIQPYATRRKAITAVQMAYAPVTDYLLLGCECHDG